MIISLCIYVDVRITDISDYVVMLLFLLYINDIDLPNCLSNCEPRMYADDAHLKYAGDCVNNLQLYLNQDLDNVHNWLRANKLNITKTEFMLNGSRQRLSTLTDSPIIKLARSPPQNHLE